MKLEIIDQAVRIQKEKETLIGSTKYKAFEIIFLSPIVGGLEQKSKLVRAINPKSAIAKFVGEFNEVQITHIISPTDKSGLVNYRVTENKFILR